MKNLHMLISVGVIAAAMTGTAIAAPKTFTIANATHATAIAVQVRPTGTTKWTPVAQREPLGYRRLVTVEWELDNCPRLDFQVLFDDGRRTVTVAKRMCARDTFTIVN